MIWQTCSNDVDDQHEHQCDRHVAMGEYTEHTRQTKIPLGHGDHFGCSRNAMTCPQTAVNVQLVGNCMGTQDANCAADQRHLADWQNTPLATPSADMLPHIPILLMLRMLILCCYRCYSADADRLNLIAITLIILIDQHWWVNA